MMIIDMAIKWTSGEVKRSNGWEIKLGKIARFLPIRVDTQACDPYMWENIWMN